MIFLVFIFIFAAVALLLIAFAAGTDKQSKKTLSRLDAIRLGAQGPGVDEGPLVITRRADVLSSIPWLDKFLQRLDVAPRLRLLLSQADLTWTAGRVMLTSVLGGVVTGYLVYLRTQSAVLAFFFLIFAGLLPFLYVYRKRNRRFDRMKQLLPEALDLMVAAIRAGHSFSSAMGMAARESPEPIKREFRQCYDEQNFGLELRVAMSNLACRVPTREIRMISTAILIQKETGGNLTEILAKVASLIRDDFRLQRQVRVHTAQGRLTGWILSLLPVVLGVGLYLVNPEHMSILWQRPIGLKMIYASAAMTIIGALISRRIIRIEI
jgi:tight adherence protein B